MKLIVYKHCAVRLKVYVCTVFIIRAFSLVALKYTAFKLRRAHLPVTIRAHFEMRTQRIHRLHAHTIQSDTLLECFRIVFAACVEHAHRLDQLALRYATSIVAHRDTHILAYLYLYTLAGIHLKLIDRVVKHLF